jgi:GDP-L-fucose synthase
MDSGTFLDFYSGKRVAVPGGGGFLGSRIVDRLKTAGAKVFVPRTADGIDFRRTADCREYFKKTKPEIVVNCAAYQGGIGFHKGREAELFMDNIRMGLFLMEAAHDAGVKKFVNVVAGCSYPGYLEKDELNEEDYWNGPVHESIFSYGFSRKASVGYGAALKRQDGWNSIHLILANMYGPGEHFNYEQSKALAGLLRRMYEAKRDGKPAVEIWGTGKPVRDWLYVEDGAEGILRAGAAYDDVAPLNIASGVGVSVRELAHVIQHIVGYEGKLVFNAEKPDGALKKTFGVKRMRAVLDWLPETPLDRGIRETLDWLRQHYDHAIAH